MKSLFDSNDNLELVNRINSLSAETQAQWGRMNVSQMLRHCQVPLQVAFGEAKPKRGLMAILFGKIARRMYLKDKPFERNLPTAPELIIKGTHVFEEEKGKLITLVERFIKDGAEGLSKEPHPFFGKLSPTEWDILQWKHLDHHLRQFGV